LGAKFVLEIEHTKTAGNAFHFRPNAYVDAPVESGADGKEIRVNFNVN
jgi:hypothetical protein